MKIVFTYRFISLYVANGVILKHPASLVALFFNILLTQIILTMPDMATELYQGAR